MVSIETFFRFSEGPQLGGVVLTKRAHGGQEHLTDAEVEEPVSLLGCSVGGPESESLQRRMISKRGGLVGADKMIGAPPLRRPEPFRGAWPGRARSPAEKESTRRHQGRSAKSELSYKSRRRAQARRARPAAVRTSSAGIGPAPRAKQPT